MTNHDVITSNLSQQKIVIGIGGGIAAYKVCGVISQLFQRGAEIRVILTESAQKFITPLTVSTLARHQAYTDTDFWHSQQSRPLHITLGEWADIMVIAPLTANTLAKLTYGIADNLLTNTVLASNCPIILAPAMNTDMWLQPIVQDNWQKLISHDSRYFPLHTNTGLLACDRTGKGRMAEVEEICQAVESVVQTRGKKDLVGKNILISGGNTREYIDSVRFISNPATGKMAIALALASYYRGGNVTLVAGNIAPELLNQLPPLNLVSVTNAQQMEKAMISNFPYADITVMSAAVGDMKPKQSFSHKLSKKMLPNHLELEIVTDIVAQLAKKKQPHQKIIGFAAQTGDIITPAVEKLERKQLDAIVTNAIDKEKRGFGSDTNEAVFIDKQGKQTPISLTSKLIMAHQILNLSLSSL